jgi:hypothetical protein
MTIDEAKQLKPGQVVMHATGNAYTVESAWPELILVRRMSVTDVADAALFTLLQKAEVRQQQLNCGKIQ